jgi:predicted RND superfamily exporter protein
MSTAGSSPWLRAIVGGSVRHPVRTLGVWLAIAAITGVGLARLEIDTSTSSFLDRDAPAWDLYQQSSRRYGGDEIIVVGLAGSHAYDPEVLRAVVALSERFSKLRGVRRVDSIATVPLIRGSAQGDLEFDAALRHGVPQSPAERERLIELLRGDRIVQRSLVSEDERVFALNLILDEDVDADRAETVAAVRSQLEGRRAWLSGVPVFRTEVNSKTSSEMLVFVPLTLLLVGGLLWLAFRSASAVGIPLAVGALGSAASLSCMAAMGATLSLSTMILPSVLLALGCAYTMHVLTASRGASDPDELLRAIDGVARPVALSGLTTAIGFVAMATVRIAAIRELASYGAVGVFCVTAAALSLAPAALALWPLGSGGARVDAWIRHAARRNILGAVVRKRPLIIGAWCALLVVFVGGLLRLQVSTDIILWFPIGSEVRDDYEDIRVELSGITPVNVLIEGKNAEPVTRPDVVAAIDALTHALNELPQVGKAISVADPLRQIHAVFSDDPDPGLPQQRDLIEQYLMLLGSVDYLYDVIARDHLGANVLLRVDENASSEIVELSEWVRSWWAAHGVADFDAVTTGIMYEFGRAEEQIAYGQIRGLVLALAVIGVILLVLLRDLRLAALALVPNALPLAVAFGFMGLVGVPLDAATVCLGSLALGIAVDDTIHVVTEYCDGIARGQKPLEALDRCFERVLPALVLTTGIVALGFGVLALSEFTLIRNLGLVTSGLVVLCLLADVTLLPALLTREGRPKSTGASPR